MNDDYYTPREAKENYVDIKPTEETDEVFVHCNECATELLLEECFPYTLIPAKCVFCDPASHTMRKFRFSLDTLIYNAKIAMIETIGSPELANSFYCAEIGVRRGRRVSDLNVFGKILLWLSLRKYRKPSPVWQ